MEEIDTKIMFNALIERFSINGLKVMCFHLDIDHENIPNTDTRDGFAMNLIDYARRNNRLPDLDIQMAIQNAAYTAQSRKKYMRLKNLYSGEAIIDEKFLLPDSGWYFENRKSELASLYQNKYSYISSPPGYGKTALIRQATRKLLEDKIVGRYFYTKAEDLNGLYDSNSMSAEIFEKNTVFIVDYFENIENKGKRILLALIKEIIERSSNQGHRLILAGRYFSPENIRGIARFIKENSHNKLEKQILFPIDNEVIEKLISIKAKIHAERNEFNYIRLLSPLKDWVDEISKLSCGHPGFIRKWIEELEHVQWNPIFPNDRKAEIFQHCFEQNIGSKLCCEAQTQKSTLEPLLESLSIFSVFDREIVLLKLSEFPNIDVDPFSIFQNLNLICEKETHNPEGFYYDSTLRGLFIKKMELLDSGKLLELISKAVVIVRCLLESYMKYERDASYRIRIYVCEFFYLRFLDLTFQNADIDIKGLAENVRTELHSLFKGGRYESSLDTMLNETFKKKDIANILNMYGVLPEELLTEWDV